MWPATSSLSSKAWCIPSRRYLTRGYLLSVPAYLSPKRNTLELSREMKILETNIHLLTQCLLDEANTAAAVLVEGIDRYATRGAIARGLLLPLCSGVDSKLSNL